MVHHKNGQQHGKCRYKVDYVSYSQQKSQKASRIEWCQQMWSKKTDDGEKGKTTIISSFLARDRHQLQGRQMEIRIRPKHYKFGGFSKHTDNV